jgi:cytoskeletal protein RodZ
MKNQTLQLDQEQAKKLADLGQHLHYLRQKQYLTLEQVAEKTKIPVRTLAAIESGRPDQLPEPVYIQGFIRRFADAIGADGTQFANDFSAEVEQEPQDTAWQGTVQAQLRPLHLYLLYTGLVVCAVSGLSFLLSRSTSQMVGLVGTAQLPAPESQLSGQGMVYGPMLPGASVSNQLPTAQPSLPPEIAQKPVRIGMTLTAQSWLRVVIDGKTEFEGMLSEGTQRIWTGEKQVTVRAGNAGGVMVSFNEAEAKRLGAPGEVEEVVFEAKPQQATTTPSLRSQTPSRLTLATMNGF